MQEVLSYRHGNQSSQPAGLFSDFASSYSKLRSPAGNATSSDLFTHRTLDNGTLQQLFLSVPRADLHDIIYNTMVTHNQVYGWQACQACALWALPTSPVSVTGPLVQGQDMTRIPHRRENSVRFPRHGLINESGADGR